MSSALVPTTVIKVNGDGVTDTRDFLAAEDPLEIRIEYCASGRRLMQSISVTMRTPGNDAELAIGFLYTEGIIGAATEIERTYVDSKNDNIIYVSLSSEEPVLNNVARNFYTTSSCGVCGKASIDAIKTVCRLPETFDNIRVSKDLLFQLPDRLRRQQEVFESTGGLHACALFATDGSLLLVKEDVGRHNALDKLIGAAIQRKLIPLDDHILLLSGRASFELIQKAIMAGIKIVAAVGAPSGLAVQMAEEWGITLIGFLRGQRFNIYSGAERIVI